MDRGAERVPPVVFEHDGRHVRPARMRTRLNRDNRAGDGRVHRGAESLAVAELLPERHAVADADERPAGCADVL